MKEFHKKSERQRLARLGAELQKFYLQQSRWPTNEQEFSFFVTPGTTSYITNELGISFVQQTNGGMKIGLVEFQDEKEIIPLPAGK